MKRESDKNHVKRAVEHLNAAVTNEDERGRERMGEEARG